MVQQGVSRRYQQAKVCCVSVMYSNHAAADSLPADVLH